LHLLRSVVVQILHCCNEGYAEGAEVPI